MGERQEGGESYSEVVSSRSGAAGSGVGGGAAARRRWRTAAASLHRLWAAGSLPWKFSGPRGSKFGGRFESRRGGAGGSAAAYGGTAAMAPAGVLWMAERSSGGLLGREREEWRGEGVAGSK